MRFEHLVQINAFDSPGLPWLTREQVWRGLALRAYDPVHFILGLEACTIRGHQRHDDREILDRTLHFGNFEVQDTVTLLPLQETRIDVAATDQWPRSSAIARIEEPEPQALFVRFIYEWDAAGANEQEMPEEIRRAREQAYLAADLDTVKRIRELADQPLS